MADTKGAAAAAKKASKPKMKKPKKPAADKTTKPADGDDDPAENPRAQIGGNTRIPSKAEMEGYFGRLDSVNTQKNEANARYMTDIKNIYEEAASKLGTSRKIMRRLYKEKTAAESFQDFIEELEPKEKDDLDRLTLGAAKAFGDDTPFGTFLKGQIESRGSSEEDHDDVKQPESNVVQIAREKIQGDERAIEQEQKGH